METEPTPKGAIKPPIDPTVNPTPTPAPTPVATGGAILPDPIVSAVSSTTTAAPTSGNDRIVRVIKTYNVLVSADPRYGDQFIMDTAAAQMDPAQTPASVKTAIMPYGAKL